MENNAYILIFKESAVSQLKRKNFTNNQRLSFYQALSKITKELVETIDDKNGKNDIIQFVKRFITNMSKDEALTPQKALESFEEEVAKQKQFLPNKKSIDLNNLDTNEETPLIRASYLQDTNTLIKLIYNGADINAQDKNKDTALTKALRNGKKDNALFLIEKGADVNIKNNWGNTALIYAISSYPDIAKLLIEKGADVNVRNINGNTPLFYAISSGKPDIIRLLVKKGADITSITDYRSSAYVHRASAYTCLNDYINNNPISKHDMPVFKEILDQLKEAHSAKNNIKHWFKSLTTKHYY